MLNTNVVSPQFMPACTSVTQATSIQTGVGPTVNNYIDSKEKYYQGRVIEVTGQEPWALASMGYMVSQKKLLLITGAKPVVDSIRFETNTQTSTINLSWSF